MAEVLLAFDDIYTMGDRSYTARVCGRLAENGMWEGWIEFDPHDGSPPLRTPRETEQSEHEDLEYWAGGLTAAYMEGALERSEQPSGEDEARGAATGEPAYDRPAPSTDDEYLDERGDGRTNARG